MSAFTIRPATTGDADAILALHLKVAAEPVGLARQPDEVTADYVAHAMAAAADGGVGLVAVAEDGSLCGERTSSG